MPFNDFIDMNNYMWYNVNTGIGNPLSYYNGYSFTWQNGRELATAVKGSNSVSYKYNTDGIRVSKVVNGILHEYTLDGTTIVREVIYTGSTNSYAIDEDLRYFYDANGYLSSIDRLQYDGGSSYTETEYFAKTNLQGDVLALYTYSSSTATLVASYTYDAWGNVISAIASNSSDIVNLNPFRYRSYYYDTELGLYYLNTRYYDPAIGRFINTDDLGYLGANGDFESLNLYVYCSNNPIMGYDPMGTWNWENFSIGTSLLLVGVLAIATAASIASCGTATPALLALASVAMTTGAVTAVNGVAEVVEAATDYNFVRDTVFEGDSSSYESFRDTTAFVADTSTTILSFYVGNVCFIAGTLIAIECGRIAIESIEVGDYVWATDPDTNETELKQVVNVFRNEATELVHVYIDGEEIVCTNEHPFYSPVKGWTSACKLKAGDIIVTLNGEYVIVECVQHEILESPITVYNFEVEGFHTYYVGNENSVLVHNKCNDGFIPDKDQQALIELAKEHQGGVSRQEANILIDWADQYGINSHSPMTHPNRSGYWSRIEHIKIYKYHIPIR